MLQCGPGRVDRRGARRQRRRARCRRRSRPASWMSPASGAACGRGASLGPGARLAVCQNWPVSQELPALTTTPVAPPSPATPASALSNLLTSSIWRRRGRRPRRGGGRSARRSHWSGDVVVDAAVEQLRDLDPEDDRELAVVDHPARLERVRRRSGTSPRPGRRSARRCSSAARGSAGPASRTRVHLVAGVAVLQRIELAELAVVDQQVDEDPQAAHARPARATCNSDCSWVSESCCGQSLNVGQPTGSWRRPAAAGERVLEHRAAPPLPASGRGSRPARRGRRSGATACRSERAPPRNSKAIMCMWASTKPDASA